MELTVKRCHMNPYFYMYILEQRIETEVLCWVLSCVQRGKGTECDSCWNASKDSSGSFSQVFARIFTLRAPGPNIYSKSSSVSKSGGPTPPPLAPPGFPHIPCLPGQGAGGPAGRQRRWGTKSGGGQRMGRGVGLGHRLPPCRNGRGDPKQPEPQSQGGPMPVFKTSPSQSLQVVSQPKLRSYVPKLDVIKLIDIEHFFVRVELHRPPLWGV